MGGPFYTNTTSRYIFSTTFCTPICAATTSVYNTVDPPYSLSPYRQRSLVLPDGASPQGLWLRQRYID